MSFTYTFHHIHHLTHNPKATAQWYQKMFDAKVIESTQSDGKPRIDVHMHGVDIFILAVAPGEKIPASPPTPYLGLDHFGFLVSDLDAAAAELKRRGAEFSTEPYSIRPGVRIAYVRGPENVRIELVERAGKS